MNKLAKNSHYLVTGLLILIVFFGLAFSLIKADFGAGAMGLGSLSENGFNMICFGSNVGISQTWFLYFMYVICLLQLLLCVTAIIFFMLAIKKKDIEWEKKVFNIFNWIIIGFLAAYMVLGFTFVGLANTAAIKYYTLAYIPALLGSFVLIANFIFTKLNFEKTKPADKTEEE